MIEKPVSNAILKWLDYYVSAKGLSGMLHFKFRANLEESPDVFCMEGHPYIHSAIVNFHDKSEVNDNSQCRHFRNFLPLRFYVKSIFGIAGVPKNTIYEVL